MDGRWEGPGAASGAASDAGSHAEPCASARDGAAPAPRGEALFSVIMAVYNAAPYVAEAIESVLAQSIGFAGNIELILVNDGSTDGSGALCQGYAERFPNIVYVEQENAGVSAARNAGLARARGRYVNFLDADDRWSADAFAAAARFFAEHPGVGVCAARMCFFDAQEGEHPLNRKFADGSRVIDLTATADCPQLSMSSAWVARALLPREPFDRRLIVSEDFLVLNTILLQELRYGVLDGPVYWYRKRQSADSSIARSRGQRSWYLDTPRLCYQGLFELSQARYGRVLPFVQHAVMYDLQWRLRGSFPAPLTAEELERYRALCRWLLERIDDSVILGQHELDRFQKLAVLAFKRGEPTAALRGRLHLAEDLTWLEEADGSRTPLWKASMDARVKLVFLKRCQEGLSLEALLFAALPAERVEVRARLGERLVSARVFERPDLAKDSFFEPGAIVRLGFLLVVPPESFTLELVLDGVPVKMSFSLGRLFPISGRALSYAALGDVLVTRSGPSFTVRPRRGGWTFKRELLYEWRELHQSEDAVARGALPVRRRAFCGRVLHAGSAFARRKRIWLISDRPNFAGDNGEALFRYLREHPVPGVEPRFLLAADSPDYERLCAIGPVVPFFSEEHERLLARATVLASSCADAAAMPPSPNKSAAFDGMPGPAFVFLQHGVTKDDISGWVKRWNKDFALFCTAAPRERASILTNPAYGYGPDVVRLTGFARFDRLLAATSEPARRLLIAPTWRKWAAMPVGEDGARPYNPAFRETEYFRFFDRLLGDEDIARAVADAGFSVHFLLHQALAANVVDFHSAYARVLVGSDYTREFAEAAILLTDYSSVAMDFAVLEKPVLYAQFDEERFFSGEHSYSRGYFDYRVDGFGPVCTTYEEMKTELLRLIGNPVMAPCYRERVEGFFGPLDGRACERIVQAILEVEGA